MTLHESQKIQRPTLTADLAAGSNVCPVCYRETPDEFVPMLVLAWDDLGEPEDPRPGNWKVIQASGEAELARFAERFREGDLIISVMGDASRIDLDALGKIAPVEQVSVEQIFAY